METRHYTTQAVRGLLLSDGYSVARINQLLGDAVSGGSGVLIQESDGRCLWVHWDRSAKLFLVDDGVEIVPRGKKTWLDQGMGKAEGEVTFGLKRFKCVGMPWVRASVCSWFIPARVIHRQTGKAWKVAIPFLGAVTGCGSVPLIFRDGDGFVKHPKAFQLPESEDEMDPIALGEWLAETPEGQALTGVQTSHDPQAEEPLEQGDGFQQAMNHIEDACEVGGRMAEWIQLVLQPWNGHEPSEFAPVWKGLLESGRALLDDAKRVGLIEKI